MTKKNAFCLVLAIGLLAITGCNLDKEDDIQNTTVAPRETAETINGSENIPSEEPEKTEEPEHTKKPEKTETVSKSEEDMDFFDNIGVGDLPKKVTLPSCAEKTDIEHLYRLNIDLGNMESLSRLSMVNDVILCGDTMQETNLLFDYNSGKQIAKVSGQADYLETGRLHNGGFWTIMQGNLETTFYDKNGTANVVRKKQDSGCCNFSYVTSDGRYELYDNVHGEIVACDLSSGKTTVCYKGTTYNRFVAETKNGCIINLADGSYLNVQPERGFGMLIYDRSQDSYEDNYNALWPFLNSEDEKQVTLVPLSDIEVSATLKKKSSKEYVMDFGLGVVITTTSEESPVMTFYNMRTKQCLGSIKAPEKSQFRLARILDNGTVLISCNNNNRTELYLYDLVSKRNAEQCLVTFKERKQKVETNPVVKMLNEKYGVRIYYGEDCKLPECDKIASPLKDKKKIETSIQAVKKFLETLPDGLTQEMYQDICPGLNIYLCGDIKDTTGIFSAVGGYCSTSNNGKIIVVVDCSGSLKSTVQILAHEFSHAFEHRIAYVSSETGVNWLQAWEDMIPANIKNPYMNSYNDNSEMEYTPYGTKKDIWFADAYARTWPTEDRARLFEYMFTPEGSKLNYRIDYKNLKYKARFYSLMMRTCFKSCEDADNLVWESYIGGVDKKEFTSVLK